MNNFMITFHFSRAVISLISYNKKTLTSKINFLKTIFLKFERLKNSKIQNNFRAIKWHFSVFVGFLFTFMNFSFIILFFS